MLARLLLPAWLGFFLVSCSSPVLADGQVDYLKQIKPVLRERCFACHGALKQEAGLRLDTAALAIKGGDSGAVSLPDTTRAFGISTRTFNRH